MGFPGGASGKEPTCKYRRQRCGFHPWVGRSPWGGHGNPLQYSCLENPMNKGAWRASVHTVVKNWTWMKWLHTLSIQYCVKFTQLQLLILNSHFNFFFYLFYHTFYQMLSGIYFSLFFFYIPQMHINRCLWVGKYKVKLFII